MKLVVRSLPVRSNRTKPRDKDNGLRYGGGPSSGRVFDEATP